MTLPASETLVFTFGYGEYVAFLLLDGMRWLGFTAVPSSPFGIYLAVARVATAKPRLLPNSELK